MAGSSQRHHLGEKWELLGVACNKSQGEATNGSFARKLMCLLQYTASTLDHETVAMIYMYFQTKNAITVLNCFYYTFNNVQNSMNWLFFFSLFYIFFLDTILQWLNHSFYDK